MTILIELCSADELLSYEALSLAFVLASFGEEVSLLITPALVPLLEDTDTRAFGMLKAVEFYDIQAVFVHDLADFAHLAPFAGQFSVFNDKLLYDSVLRF